jgi:molybdenum cofactor cytidylyltransferase
LPIRIAERTSGKEPAGVHNGAMAGVPGRRTIVGVLLAAGRGERFGGDKLLAPLRDGDIGVPIGVAACRRLRAALPDVVAVVRPGDAGLAQLLEQAGASVIVARNADEGIGASLAAGVAALADDADGYVVALADMPWIDPATTAAIAQALRRGASIVAPRYRGERGHPVGFAAIHRGALMQLGGDEGARSILSRHRADLQLVDVDDPGVLRDVDTPADLTKESSA